MATKRVQLEDVIFVVVKFQVNYLLPVCLRTACWLACLLAPFLSFFYDNWNRSLQNLVFIWLEMAVNRRIRTTIQLGCAARRGKARQVEEAVVNRESGGGEVSDRERERPIHGPGDDDDDAIDACVLSAAQQLGKRGVHRTYSRTSSSLVCRAKCIHLSIYPVGSWGGRNKRLTTSWIVLFFLSSSSSFGLAGWLAADSSRPGHRKSWGQRRAMQNFPPKHIYQECDQPIYSGFHCAPATTWEIVGCCLLIGQSLFLLEFFFSSSFSRAQSSDDFSALPIRFQFSCLLGI